MRLGLIGALAALLLLPSAANADGPVTGPAELLQPGREYWGMDWPPGCDSIAVTVSPEWLYDEGWNYGSATQPQPGTVIPCEMTVWEGVLDELPRCLGKEVLVHEYGHLLGFGHSSDPSSVMYPDINETLCPKGLHHHRRPHRQRHHHHPL